MDGGIVREGADPNKEIGGPEMEDDRRGTEIETAIGTGTVTVTEIETRIGDVDPRAEEGGTTMVAGLPGPVGWKRPNSPNSLHRQRGKHLGGSLRSRGWPRRPGKAMMDLLARRPPP